MPTTIGTRAVGVLRIVTWNVHACIGGDARVSTRRVAEALSALEADVIALQEIDVGRARTGGANQLAELASALDMDARFSRAMRRHDGDYGIGMLTRLEVIAEETRSLPRPGLPFVEPRVALLLRLRHPRGLLCVVNTHLGLIPYERLRQVRALLPWLTALRADGPTVLCGDLNASPRASECRLLDPVLPDAFGDGVEGCTFPVKLPMSRLDHIRASPDLERVAVAIPRTPLTCLASDHFPVVADFRLSSSQVLTR